MLRIAILMLGAAPAALAAQTAPAPVSADAQAPAATDDEATAGAEGVVVGTAGGGTRRQDAAFAVTTLSSEAIQRAAPNSTADILRNVPGVMAEGSGGQNGANIFVRGYPSGGDAPTPRPYQFLRTFPICRQCDRTWKWMPDKDSNLD